MPAQTVRLSLLLRERHWQTYSTFVREYRKAARTVDSSLEKNPPSRAQFYRWISGDIKGLPYADHCLVLEKMFPEWPVAQLLAPLPPAAETADTTRESASGPAPITRLFSAIDAGLSNPGAGPGEWGQSSSDRPDMSRAGASSRVPVPVSTHAGAVSETTRELGQRLLTLAKARRLPLADTEQLACLAGNVVELDLTLDIDVAADGAAMLTYRHELLNMSSRPLTRLAREVWFEHTTGPITITPVSEVRQHVAIQRVHDAGSLAKFACQISPPIRPGETGVISYSCGGGRFLDDHYWRQSIPRYTRHLTIRLRHRGGGQLSVCTAVEEHPDGSDNSATDDLMWDYEDDDVVIMLTRDYLRPNQAVTLRWAVSNEPA